MIVQKWGIPLHQIYLADETRQEVEPAPRWTLDPKGSLEHEVVQDTGSRKKGFTILLTCSATGMKPPPLTVFPLKTRAGVDLPSNQAQQPTPHGSTPSSIFAQDSFEELYLDKLLLPFILANSDPTAKPFPPHTLIFLDAGFGHLSPTTAAKCKANNIHVELVPECTAAAQSFDRTLFHPFHLEMNERILEWERAREEAKKQYGPEKVKHNAREKRSRMLFCVQDTWYNAITEEQLKKGAAVVGISSTVDPAFDSSISVHIKDRYLKPERSLWSLPDPTDLCHCLSCTLAPKTVDLSPLALPPPPPSQPIFGLPLQ